MPTTKHMADLLVAMVIHWTNMTRKSPYLLVRMSLGPSDTCWYDLIGFEGDLYQCRGLKCLPLPEELDAMPKLDRDALHKLVMQVIQNVEYAYAMMTVDVMFLDHIREKSSADRESLAWPTHLRKAIDKHRAALLDAFKAKPLPPPNVNGFMSADIPKSLDYNVALRYGNSNFMEVARPEEVVTLSVVRT